MNMVLKPIITLNNKDILNKFTKRYDTPIIRSNNKAIRHNANHIVTITRPSITTMPPIINTTSQTGDWYLTLNKAIHESAQLINISLYVCIIRISML